MKYPKYDIEHRKIFMSFIHEPKDVLLKNKCCKQCYRFYSICFVLFVVFFYVNVFEFDFNILLFVRSEKKR